MASRKPHVLVIEDDPVVRDTVATALRGEGYDVCEEADALRVERLVTEVRPEVVILDIRLPIGPNGISAARMIRLIDTEVPILFLSAASDVHDRLEGFGAGADDYMTKPFSVAELLARVAALRRRAGLAEHMTWHVADLVVDESARTVSRAGTLIRLTKTEFDLLHALGRNRGRVLSKAQLLADVWGFADYDPNLVEVYIGTLRRKLEAHGPRLVHTVHGVGYVLRG